LEGDAPLDADTIELVNVVTAQLAQQVENLRLLDQSERYRDEMEVALRRATREEWQEYTSAPENKVLAYQYSGDEVTALENEANAGSEVTVPIKVQDEMIGQFGLQDIKTLSEEDQELVNVISEQLSAHLENMRLYSAAQREIAERQRLGDIITRQYEQTQASESLIRSVINATPDWIFIKDQQHRYRLVNQGYANSLHINLDDFIGKNDLELGFPEELVKGNPEKGIAGFWADDRRVMDSGETEIIPNDVVMIDGLLRTFNTIKTPLRDANGQVLGVLAFARDVTDREAVLADTEALYNVTSRLARSRSQKEVLDAVVEGTVMHNFDTASIYFFDQPWRENEKPKLLITEAFWERVPGSFPARLNMPLPVQAVPGIEKLVESPYIFIEDARTYADMPDLLRQMLVESKMLSVLNVRLIVGGEWVGTISATCEQPQVITEADVRRLLTLVDQAAAVFYGLLQYQSTQARARREQTLREITAHVRSSMDPEAILRTAVRELGNALGRQTFIRLGSPEQLMEKPAPGNGHAANGKNESTSLTGEGGK
jgi:PAS domain S-box-containing protein